MRIKYILIIMLIAGFVLNAYAGAQEILIGTDENYWYPFTYLGQDGQIAGMHIDIVNKAMEKLGFQPKYTSLPWKRCLSEAKHGRIVAIVSASYKPERALYLIYPEDARTVHKSKYRIMQVEYVAVTSKDNPYEFNGDLKTLPQPVRSVLGYSITDYLRENQIPVIIKPHIEKNIRSLVRNKKGVVITTPRTAQAFNQLPEFLNQLKINAAPIQSKSYFMPFSKKNQTLSYSAIQNIWDEIVRLRENNGYMRTLEEKYRTVP